MHPANRLRSRPDFDRARTGRRVSCPEFVLYHSPREEAPSRRSREQASERPRVGFAVGRRLGGAVVRNRIRRRLREAIRPLLPRLVACDIVVVARSQALEAGVSELSAALEDAAARAGLIRT